MEININKCFHLYYLLQKGYNKGIFMIKDSLCSPSNQVNFLANYVIILFKFKKQKHQHLKIIPLMLVKASSLLLNLQIQQPSTTRMIATSRVDTSAPPTTATSSALPGKYIFSTSYIVIYIYRFCKLITDF